MITIHHIAQRHCEWLKMARALGGGDMSEDIVQEMYLRLLEKQSEGFEIRNIEYKGQVNTFYIFTVIRSITVDGQRRTKAAPTVIPIDGIQVEDCEPYDADGCHQKATAEQVCAEVIQEMHWYNRRVLELSEKMSIRRLARETGISHFSLWHTLKKTKEYVKNETQKRLRR